MTWNYRIIKRHHITSKIITFEIHEVYYNKDGKINGWSAGPTAPHGETILELVEDLQHCMEALTTPVLVEQTEDGREILVESPDQEQALLAIAIAKVKEAIGRTEDTIKKVDHCLENLSSCPDFPTIEELRAKPGESVNNVFFIDNKFGVDLQDGRTITVPLSWYPKLTTATKEQLLNWQIYSNGYGIHWPDIDEKIPVYRLLEGTR